MPRAVAELAEKMDPAMGAHRHGGTGKGGLA
jgi:hypothetical protein